MSFLLLIGNIAEFANQHPLIGQLQPVGRPDRDGHTTPVFAQNVMPKDGLRSRYPLLKIKHDLFALSLGVQLGEIRPNEFLARIPHQRFCCRIHIHHDPSVGIQD
jgi:hypothetical protein